MITDTVKGKSLSYSLMKPVRVRPTIAYPLVILLHASGGSMYDLVGIASGIDDIHNFYAVPNGPFIVSKGFGKANSWQPAPDATDAPNIDELLEGFFAEAKERSGVAPGNMVIAGFGDAAPIALRFGLAHPGEFKGIASAGSLDGASLPSATGEGSVRIFLAATNPAQAEGVHGVEANLKAAGFAVEHHEYGPPPRSSAEAVDAGDGEGSFEYALTPPHPELKDLVAWIKETLPPPPR